MDKDEGPSPVEGFHDGLESRIAEVHTAVSAQEGHAVEFQDVKRVLDLSNRRSYIWHGEGRESTEALPRASGRGGRQMCCSIWRGLVRPGPSRKPTPDRYRRGLGLDSQRSMKSIADSGDQSGVGYPPMVK